MLPACGARGGEGSSGRRMGGREEETEGEERVGKVWIGRVKGGGWKERAEVGGRHEGGQGACEQ